MAEIGSAVAGKVVDSLFVVAKKEIGYIWNCSENVQKLRHEAEKLKVMRGRVQELIDTSIRRGDRLSYGVEDWVKEAETEISKADAFLEQEAHAKKTCCKIGLCGNWGTLHRYGKSATKMAPSLLQIQERGSTYQSCVSVETPVPGPLDVYQNKDLDDLHTHNSALGNILKSLEDESIQVTGIYGLGGVGKTTLAMEVVARVKNNMFADVAFTTVSQNVDVEKIKKDIGEATKRIMKGDKILIILDDVWEKLNLEELCIPCGNNYINCKILLTSRSEKVCQKMNAQIKICVNSLPSKEAWILFRRVVGERLETDSNLRLVALKVVEECGGLPLLIQAVGNALKDESNKSWERALTQLQKHAPLDIDDEIRISFTHLKLSYDYLKSEEAKSCFLLCSMFPEDYKISLEDLVNYVVGLEEFDDLDCIDDARGRVQNAVNILTSSGLLLKINDERFTKMHDVVRDVALLIASQGDNKFLVKARQGLTEWLPRDTGLESYKGIALMFNDISELPDYEVHLPHLQLFIVCGNEQLSKIPDEFIRCMKKVKVLDIAGNDMSSLPQSFQFLTKLRMLDLSGNESLDEISILQELKDLEILNLNETGITEIPKEIAQLVNLRVLQVKCCEDLSRITRGVISALRRLEELSIDFNSKFNGASDCIVEVMSLSKLTYLDLTVPDIDDIPAQGQGFNSENLKGFEIRIGGYIRAMIDWKISRSDRYLVLSNVHIKDPLPTCLKKLIEVSRLHIFLSGIDSLNNMMSISSNKIEHIELDACSIMSCLVDEGKTKEKLFKELKHLELWNLYNLEMLWKCPDQYISLTNLVKLIILNCNKLKRVFTVSVAQGLLSLKELRIENCIGLKEVIWGNGGGDESGNVIVFPSLVTISFYDLPRLKRFFNSVGNYSMGYPCLVNVSIQLCDNMKTWGSGIHETPNLKSFDEISDIPLDEPCAINEAVERSWRMLNQIARELRLRDIGGIIVLDFIDMSDDFNKRLVHEEVRKTVQRDSSLSLWSKSLNFLVGMG